MTAQPFATIFDHAYYYMDFVRATESTDDAKCNACKAACDPAPPKIGTHGASGGKEESVSHVRILAGTDAPRPADKRPTSLSRGCRITAYSQI